VHAPLLLSLTIVMHTCRYMTSTLRRVATESVLPWILEAWTGHVSQTSNSDATSRVSEGEASSHDTTSKATVAQVKPTGQWLWSVCEQSLRDLYDPFDDYLEMVIEFGYVSLFASAFPLAAAISVAANVVEVRSDAWRLGGLWRCTALLLLLFPICLFPHRIHLPAPHSTTS